MIHTLGPYPLRTPSKNHLKASPGRHAWNRDRAITRAWGLIIRPCPEPLRPFTLDAKGYRVGRMPRKLVVVVLLAHGDRRFDILNLYAGLNPVVDVLVQKGYLANDSPIWLTDVRASEVPGPKGRSQAETLITIESA